MHGVRSFTNSPYSLRQRDNRVRKSERIRLLEMEMLRMQFQIEYVSRAIDILLQESKVAGPELDAGKWYNAKLNKDK
jgi:hypothetical protein